MWPGFRFAYRRGINNLLVLLIGGIPIGAFFIGICARTRADDEHSYADCALRHHGGRRPAARQVQGHRHSYRRCTSSVLLNSAISTLNALLQIEELAGVTILCSDKTGTLTTNKLTIDKSTVKTYGGYSVEDVCLLAAYASRTENQDAIDMCVTGTVGLEKCRAGIKLLDFKPFDPVAKRTEITYIDESSGTMKRVTKGMTGRIIELCTRNKTSELEDKLEADVEEYARRGLRALAVAYEDVPSNDKEAEGNGFELIGLLAIFDPPRDDTKATIDEAQAMGVKVKMVTGDQLAIAKETGRRLGMGDHMYPAKVLSEGPAAGGKHLTLDEMILGRSSGSPFESLAR